MRTNNLNLHSHKYYHYFQYTLYKALLFRYTTLKLNYLFVQKHPKHFVQFLL